VPHSPFLAFFFLILRPPPSSTLFPYTTLFRSQFVPAGANTLHFAVVKSDDTHFLSGLQDQFIVLRPDRYILGVFTEENADIFVRSEEHTSELQSQSNLVCRLLLEKKKKNNIAT